MTESEGYRSIAEFLAEEPGVVILNRFRVLNIQNLLYMQAELYHLEDELQHIAKEDSESACSDRQNYRYSILDLKRSLKGKEDFQWKKILEIRDKLERYNEAILRYDRISALHKPPKLEVSNVRHVLRRNTNSKFLLKDIDAGARAPKSDEDLVALSNSNINLDPFATWARGSLIVYLHKYIGFKVRQLDPETGLASYGDKRLRNVINAFRSLIVTAVPAVSMTVLYVVKSMAIRLVAIVLFAAIFTLLVALFTNARTEELFMLTMAFAAVQVVFLGTTN